MAGTMTSQLNGLRLVAVFLLSVFSLFFLDGALSFSLTESAGGSSARMALFAIYIFFRAAIAEWVASAIMGVQSLDSSEFRFRGLTLSAVVYGPPLLTIQDRLHFYLLLNLVPPSLGQLSIILAIIVYTLIFDFSRMMLFLAIKKSLLRRLQRPTSF
jgi:hypothetical protein